MLKTPVNDSSDLSFGRRLRLERERRRITLDSIAANTKIGLPLLAGLERDDVSRWPSGIFRRSFIREYASAIGLDPDETTREFLRRFPDPAESTTSAPVRVLESPVLRLTLADTDSGFVRGDLLAESWRRWAAVAWDLSSCLVIGGMLFLALDQWWKPLAIGILGYYAASILALGNTPGVFFFARMPTSEGHRRGLRLSPRLQAALSRIRRLLRLARVHAPKAIRRLPDTPTQRAFRRRVRSAPLDAPDPIGDRTPGTPPKPAPGRSLRFAQVDAPEPVARRPGTPPRMS